MYFLFNFLVGAVQLTQPLEEQPIAKPIVIMLVLVILSLAPFLLMMTTSFVKVAVVFSMIRQALGTQQIPPNQIVTGLALILTIYIMLPVGAQVYEQVQGVIRPQESNQDMLSQASIDSVKRAVEAGKEPVRAFLTKHANPKDRALFYNMAKQLRGNITTYDIGENDFIVLMPAFIVSELAQAFQIGFVLYLPFLVLDMVVSNVLLSMGMFMVSPITVALPFKLLLFVLVDGWFLITKGLVQGYM
ncbi:MAG: Type III secretion apparatus protein, YscR/HrcR family [uncultured bacterium]|nr:MAG: Type III secretion apparatus protein, YscR/HrcR family [uncultured bacterium]